MGRATAFFGPPPGALGRGQQVKYHLISIAKSISKIFFIPNFVCVLTNERYKTYQTGFSFCCLGHAPGVGLLGAGGAQVVKENLELYCGRTDRQTDRQAEGWGINLVES